MMHHVRALGDSLRSSLWFVPTLLVLGAIVLALSLIELDNSFQQANLGDRWPRLFGAGAEGSRGMLTAIATSMITVAGVAFSITIVALTLASSQYTSRILRNFMRDRSNQTVLGSFLGIFVYCVVVLRTIRSGEEGSFVPSLAVLFAVALAIMGIGCLIYFIHHIASSIQAESIIQSAASETIEAIDRLFPTEMGEAADPVIVPEAEALALQKWLPMPAGRSGYLQGIDGDGLVEFARELKGIIRMERGIGEFVVDGAALASIATRTPPEQSTIRKLNSFYTIGSQRTIVQDAGFGIRQIVDVALKALSPGINDTTTAVTCVHYLTAILARLGSRVLPTPFRMEASELRVIARGPSFKGLLSEAFDQIRQNARGNVAVLFALLEGLEVIAARASEKERRQALQDQLELVSASAEQSIPESRDCECIHLILERLGTLDS